MFFPGAEVVGSETAGNAVETLRMWVPVLDKQRWQRPAAKPKSKAWVLEAV